MKVFYSVLLLLVAAFEASARPAVVRTGEHGDFTRLVIQAENLSGWSVSETGNQVSLILPENTEGYDISTVFYRIGRNRIVDISQADGQLSIETGCECELETDLVDGTFLVLDFKDVDLGEEPEPNESNSEDHTSQPGPDNIEQLSEADAEPVDLNFMTLPGEMPQNQVQLPAENFLSAIETIDPNTAERSNSDVSEFESQLAEQIGTAATIGLLSINIARPAASSAPPQLPVSETLDDQLSRGADISDNSTELNSRNEPLISFYDRNHMDSFSCSDGDEFSIDAWGVENEFNITISRLRSQLFGEFDSINKEAQLELARAYAFFGFGFEAIRVLDLDFGNSREEYIILTIARILEMGTDPSETSLISLSNCENEASIWSILSTGGNSDLSDLSRNAAIRSLEGFPWHLREYLTPVLSAKLRLIGDLDLAERTMRIKTRTGEEPDSAQNLELAELADSSGSREEASIRYQEVLDENSFESPRALVQYIDLQVAGNRKVSDDIALLAESYAMELRETELGADIRRAHIMALSKSGQFDKALEVLAASRNAELDSDAVFGAIFAVIHSDASEMEFLKHILTLPSFDNQRVPGRVRLEIAERLLELGFPEQSRSWLSDIDTDVFPVRQALAQGAVELDAGNYQITLELLEEHSGPKASDLKAQALLGLGLVEEAMAIRSSLDQDDRVREMAWELPEPSADDVEISDALHSTIALENRQLDIKQEGALSEAEALLSDTASLTQEIQESLSQSEIAF